jgi:ABC-type transport system substrate-binding protein
MQGDFDLSNNFRPGVATLVDKGYVSTYYKQAPYMLSANTAWLVTNDQKPPLDDKEFRKAIASAVNVPDIVNKVYGNIVKAADPTGLLPAWTADRCGQRDALLHVRPGKGHVDPRCRRLQEGRRRVLREQGRVGAQAHDHGPQRLVRLGGRA